MPIPCSPGLRRTVRPEELITLDDMRRAGWCAKSHGGETAKLSDGSRERRLPAFVGRARARRVRLFGNGTRNRRCPGTRARQPSVTTDVVDGHKDDLALTCELTFFSLPAVSVRPWMRRAAMPA
jgi:hypothetical protein